MQAGAFLSRDILSVPPWRRSSTLVCSKAATQLASSTAPIERAPSDSTQFCAPSCRAQRSSTYEDAGPLDGMRAIPSRTKVACT